MKRCRCLCSWYSTSQESGGKQILDVHMCKQPYIRIQISDHYSTKRVEGNKITDHHSSFAPITAAWVDADGTEDLFPVPLLLPHLTLQFTVSISTPLAQASAAISAEPLSRKLIKAHLQYTLIRGRYHTISRDPPVFFDKNNWLDRLLWYWRDGGNDCCTKADFCSFSG